MLNPSPSVQYIGDGATTSFTVSFPFVSRSDIQVFVNGTQTYAFSWTSNGQVSISPAPVAGAVVLIARHTVADTSGFNFQSGALRPADLNNAMRQVLYISQEGNDAADDANTAAGQALTSAQQALNTANIAQQAVLTAPAGVYTGSQDGIGAFVQIIRNKVMETVDVSDFCYGIDALTASGATNLDESIGLSAAIATAHAKNAKLRLNGLKVLTGSQTIPVGMIFEGTSRGGQQFSANYYATPSQLRLQPGATITLNSGCAVRDMTLIPSGLNVTATSAAALQALIASFVGTALTGNSLTDVELRGLMILGFAQGVSLIGGGRYTVDDCMIDCTSGLACRACLDTNRISRVHVWPYLTAPQSAGQPQTLYRSGTAFQLGRTSTDPGAGQDDWTIVRECMAYCTEIGYDLTGGSNIHLIACQADGNSNTSTSVAYKIAGGAFDNKLIACTGFNHNTCVQVNSNATAGGAPIAVTIIGGLLYGYQYGVDWQTGNLIVTDRPHISASNGFGFSIDAGAGNGVADLGDIEATVAVYVDPAYAGSVDIALPPHGGWQGSAIQGPSGAPITAAQKLQVALRGAQPLHLGVPNRMLAPLEIRSNAPTANLTLASATGAANNNEWSVVTKAATSVNGNALRCLSITAFSDNESAAADFLQLIGSGTAFITAVMPSLPVAASDSAAASANVPVGGLYKTSAGAVMQRTT